MPKDGLIAFCTFYSDDVNNRDIMKPLDDPFDRIYKKGSVLTQLRFKLKKCVTDVKLVKDFSITLYPNSLFLISLSTNRLYTHEIVPPSLAIDKIPTRLGYVIRCSNTKAVHKSGTTYISHGEKDNYVKLEKPTERDVEELKDFYYQENFTDNFIDYGKIYYSMNDGDYKEPLGIM